MHAVSLPPYRRFVLRLTRWLRPLLGLLLLYPLADLSAQAALRTSTRALDLSLGLGYGVGGPTLPHRGLLAAGALLSEPVRPLRRGTFVLAIDASLHLTSDFSDCVTDLAVSPRGCRDYPSHVAASLLGGWAQRDDQGSGLRIFAGPGYFRMSDDRAGLGLSTRVDGAERLSSRVSFVFWAEGRLPPSRRGERLSNLTAGLGLRVR